jgi:hypothetical protein
MDTVEVWVDRPKPKLLTFECTTSPDGHTVPTLTRKNVAQLLYWLWEFDPEAGPLEGGSTIPYLLDDLMEMLRGGVFSIAYPTDHGKSTLVDADTVISIILWPEETLNLIIKAAVETAVASAQACAFKLTRAAEYFPYARPLCRWDLQTGMPQVKSGYFVEGCRLRSRGERNRSVYPAGIGSRSVQGMRGRTKLDDLEDQNTLKSEAREDTLRNQVNNAVRGLQVGEIALWAILGTPQGVNSVMNVVQADLSRANINFRVIRRPRVIQEGPYKGQLLFPRTETKRIMQEGIMDRTAYNIAWELKLPGEGRYDGETALKNILDRELPLLRNETELRDHLYERLLRDGARHVGFAYENYGEFVRKTREAVTDELGLYIGWDPATVGTYALCLEAILPRTRWLIRVRVDSGDSVQQAEQILEWQALFPSVTVVVERDGQQDAFIDILRLMDPSCMIVPHTTHGYNKNTRHSGVPGMMGEFLKPGAWHFPYMPEDYLEEYLEIITREVKRWGPSAHPHALMALWFPWYYDKHARMEPDDGTKQPDSSEAAVLDVIMSGQRPLQDPFPRAQPQQSPSQAAWNRRWPSLRK